MVETSTQGQIGAIKPQVYNVIRGIDINEVMRVIFGDKKNTFDFWTVPIKPVVQNTMINSPVATNWLYGITKLDRDNTSDLGNELGFYNKTSDIGIMTQTF